MPANKQLKPFPDGSINGVSGALAPFEEFKKLSKQLRKHNLTFSHPAVGSAFDITHPDRMQDLWSHVDHKNIPALRLASKSLKDYVNQKGKDAMSLQTVANAPGAIVVKQQATHTDPKLFPLWKSKTARISPGAYAKNPVDCLPILVARHHKVEVDDDFHRTDYFFSEYKKELARQGISPPAPGDIVAFGRWTSEKDGTLQKKPFFHSIIDRMVGADGQTLLKTIERHSLGAVMYVPPEVATLTSIPSPTYFTLKDHSSMSGPWFAILSVPKKFALALHREVNKPGPRAKAIVLQEGDQTYCFILPYHHPPNHHIFAPYIFKGEKDQYFVMAGGDRLRRDEQVEVLPSSRNGAYMSCPKDAIHKMIPNIKELLSEAFDTKDIEFKTNRTVQGLHTIHIRLASGKVLPPFPLANIIQLDSNVALRSKINLFKDMNLIRAYFTSTA